MPSLQDCQDTQPEPQRELVLNVQLVVAWYPARPPTEQELADYVQAYTTQAESHESEAHIHGVTLMGWGPQGG